MRLIDADELIEFLKKVTITDGITFETGFKQILTDIKNQHTVEPVRVIHCKDCDLLHTCRYAQYLGLDGYCSNAEKGGADMRKKVKE